MSSIILDPFPGYRLLDSGQGLKLEEVAGLRVVRPCAQAVWRRRLPESAWSTATARCVRHDDGGGHWERRPAGSPPILSWEEMRFALRWSSFGHLGIFCEQIPLWTPLRQAVLAAAGNGERPRLLNLFGYTGCASLVMAAAGAQVFHVDSAKGVLDWGRENARLNAIPDDQISWIQEDVRSFLRLVAKRRFSYHAILVDPPAWGHGPRQEVWTWDEGIADLLDGCRQALAGPQAVLVLTCHTPGVQAATLGNLVGGSGPWAAGDLGIRHAEDDRILPAGLWAWAGPHAPAG